MKVYFINLDRSPERLEWFHGQTQGMGLDLVRVPAVDARELPEAEADRLRALSSGRNSLSAGELGCFLSHRKVWQMVVEDNAPWAFIAEDDIHFSRNAADFLRGCDWIPQGAEMIKAETALKRVELGAKVLGRPFGHELRRLISYHFCSGGYFLTPKAAAYLLEYSRRHCEPVDEVLFSPKYGVLNHLGCLQLSPAICIQDNFASPAAGAAKLESIIKAERVSFHRFDPRGKKLRGWRKIPREMKRAAGQLFHGVRMALMYASGRSVFRRISIDTAGVGFSAKSGNV